MVDGIVLALSILLQLTAAGLALRLAWITRGRLAWSLIAAAILLMTVRRGITFARLVAGDGTLQPDLAAELVALVISVLVLAGIGLLLPMVRSARASSEAVRENEQRIRGILDNMEDGVITITVDGTVESFNRAAERIFGYGANEVIGNNVRMLMKQPDAEQHDAILRRYLDTGVGRILGVGPRELTGRRRDGTELPIDLSIAEMEIGAHRVFIGVVRDITARKQADAALRESEERFRTLARIAPVGIFETDAEGKCIHVNQRWCEIAGIDEEAARGDGWSRAIHPEDREGVMEEWVAATAENMPFALQFRFQRPDGVVSWVLGQAAHKTDSDGCTTGYVGAVTDITGPREVELQLAQAQKMEAVGQLTGGVAHDFNNLLTVVMGNLELLQKYVGDDSEAGKFHRTALAASERGADLTRRLLAFSRRQLLSPEPTAVNARVPEIIELIHRTIGEHIEIVCVLADDLGFAMVDPVQLDSALVNLAVNARDAMPQGGKLTIETADARLDEDYAAGFEDVTPGDYIMVAVSDSGVGMPPDVVARAFEPFFTTKEVGQGSGMGLSMVYGFARQTGGHVRIYSEVGIGTTVKIYLPRTAEDGRAVDVDTEPDRKPDLATGEETILVVEDDAEVRAFAATALSGLGYDVLQAADGPAALALLPAAGAIDLLLTDVVLPRGMNGREVADEFRRRYPAIAVLFTSGYAQNAIDHNGRLDDDVDFLAKPYTRENLAHRVRAALARR